MGRPASPGARRAMVLSSRAASAAQNPTPITVAICSNRPSELVGAVRNALGVLDDGDRLLVVVDTEETDLGGLAAHSALVVLHNGQNCGLAYSRNRVLKECETQFVLFVDDDIALSSGVVQGVRRVLGLGADIVGVRIAADFQQQRVPWFLTAGQLHYLGAHNPAAPASIWGGCLAVDINLTRLLGVVFDEELGRRGTRLASAEDTTFVRHMLIKGAKQEVLDELEVAHRILPERLKLRYLLRRAYWQGRSEVRRDDAWHGLRKEWQRNRQASDGAGGAMLAACYVGFVAMGMIYEYLVTR